MFFIVAIVGFAIPVCLGIGFAIYHVVKDWRARGKKVARAAA